MAKYFAQTETGKPEEIPLEKFIQMIQGEFMFGPNYYEYFFMQVGKGEKFIGTRHMFWMKW